MGGTDGDGIVETKLGEIRFQIIVLFVIDLVDDQHDGALRFAQKFCQVSVDRIQAGLAVDDEQNHVALAHRGVGGQPDLRR